MLKNGLWGAPGWLSWLSVWPQLRVRSHGPWVRAPLSGSGLMAQSLEPVSDSLSPSLSALTTLVLCLSLSKTNKHFKKLKKEKDFHLKWILCGAPGWLSRLSVQLWLRLRYRGSWIQALRWALYWHLRAQSLLQILCLPLSLPLPCSCSVSLSFSKINKHFKIFIKK